MAVGRFQNHNTMTLMLLVYTCCITPDTRQTVVGHNDAKSIICKIDYDAIRTACYRF